VYAYNARNLWAAYGPAIFVTLLSVAVGFQALFSNGVSHGTSFSAILATTRNRTLDEMMVGCSLGAHPMRKDILHTRLRFGVLEGDESGKEGNDGNSREFSRAGFGLESQVKPLEKGAVCY
jgi:hypothetical protein